MTQKGLICCKTTNQQWLWDSGSNIYYCLSYNGYYICIWISCLNVTIVMGQKVVFIITCPIMITIFAY